MYGQSVIQSLPYDEILFDKIVKLKDILNTPDDSAIGYFIEVDLKYPDNIKEKTKTFSLALLELKSFKKINIMNI